MPEEKEEELQLRALYDELWHDAKTLVRDMSRSISMFQFAGIMLLLLALLSFLWVALGNLLEIWAGTRDILKIFNALFGTFASIVFIVYGARLIRWYYKLKDRYAKLLELESTIED